MSSFANVLGQSIAVDLLARALREDRLAGAYLFAGPEGVGKQLAAFALASAALCNDGVEDACGRCATCIKLAAGTHPDWIHIQRPDDKKEIPVAAIRELQQRLTFAPNEARRRVVLIVEADELSQSASNALLKTLEEPPARTHFVLVSSAMSALLPTIRSRCQIVRFVPLGIEHLRTICRAHGASEAAAAVASSLAGGRASVAVAALAQGELEAERARAEAFDDAAATRSLAASLAAAGDASADKGAGLARTLELLQTFYRDVLVAKEGLQGSVLAMADRKDRITARGASLGAGAVLTRLEVLQAGLARLERNANPTLVAEWVALRFREATR